MNDIKQIVSLEIGNNIQELVKKVNLILKDPGCFATPFYQDLIFPHRWYCLVYSTTISRKTNTRGLATEKQKNFLYKLNADFDAEVITCADAKKLIEELLKKRNKATKG